MVPALSQSNTNAAGAVPRTGRPVTGSDRATFLRVLPARLKRYRVLRGFTQATLAAEAGVARSTVQAIEGGYAGDIQLTTLESLCHALMVSADALLGFNSIRLVRMPKLKAIQMCDATPEIAPAYICADCGSRVKSRAMHLAVDCIQEMSNNGETDYRIGAVFGLSVAVVAFILNEPHARG